MSCASRASSSTRGAKGEAEAVVLAREGQGGPSDQPTVAVRHVREEHPRDDLPQAGVLGRVGLGPRALAGGAEVAGKPVVEIGAAPLQLGDEGPADLARRELVGRVRQALAVHRLDLLVRVEEQREALVGGEGVAAEEGSVLRGQTGHGVDEGRGK